MGIATDSSQVKTSSDDDFKDLKTYKPVPVVGRKLKKNFASYTGKKKGVIYIFSHYEYKVETDENESAETDDIDEKELAKRKGTEKDEQSLIKLFTKLGFDIKGPNNECQVFKDCTRKQIFDEIRNVKEEDYESIGIIIMSHGKLDKIVAYDGWYSEKKLLNALNGKFEDKLKFFIIQACRKVSGSENRFLMNLPRTDMLVLHSAYPETDSNRDPENGTYLIQILCKRLSLINEERDFLDEMTFVKRDVANWTKGAQMPIMSHSMTKYFFIGPCSNEMEAKPSQILVD